MRAEKFAYAWIWRNVLSHLPMNKRQVTPEENIAELKSIRTKDRRNGMDNQKDSDAGLEELGSVKSKSKGSKDVKFKFKRKVFGSSEEQDGDGLEEISSRKMKSSLLRDIKFKFHRIFYTENSSGTEVPTPDSEEQMEELKSRKSRTKAAKTESKKKKVYKGARRGIKIITKHLL
jgi:hypothetical protein